MTDAAAGVADAIAAGNAAYEERFGRVFLIRAAGRSPEQILAELRRRLGNDDDAEAREALGQLAEIAILRLRGSVTEVTEQVPRARGSPHDPPHHARAGCRDRSPRGRHRRRARRTAAAAARSDRRASPTPTAG